MLWFKSTLLVIIGLSVICIYGVPLQKDTKKTAVNIEGEGDYKQAEEEARRALRDAELRFGPDHVEVAQCAHDLAAICMLQDKNDEAERLLKRSLAISGKALTEKADQYRDYAVERTPTLQKATFRPTKPE
jgi:tetratricopeptide (TPR) repeat protein